MRNRIAGLMLICGALTISAKAASGQDRCVLQGTTVKMVGDNYVALANVPIAVYREGGPVASAESGPDSVKNLRDGEFQLAIPAGSPVTVLFTDPSHKLLPELQSLAAASKTSHTIHVCLLTEEQAKERKIDPFKYVQSIISQLEARGVTADDKVLRALKAQLARLAPAAERKITS